MSADGNRDMVDCKAKIDVKLAANNQTKETHQKMRLQSVPFARPQAHSCSGSRLAIGAWPKAGTRPASSDSSTRTTTFPSRARSRRSSSAPVRSSPTSTSHSHSPRARPSTCCGTGTREPDLRLRCTRSGRGRYFCGTCRCQRERKRRRACNTVQLDTTATLGASALCGACHRCVPCIFGIATKGSTYGVLRAGVASRSVSRSYSAADIRPANESRMAVSSTSGPEH